MKWSSSMKKIQVEITLRESESSLITSVPDFINSPDSTVVSFYGVRQCTSYRISCIADFSTGAKRYHA